MTTVKKKKVLILCGDLAALLLALAAMIFLRYGAADFGIMWQAHAQPMLVVGLFWIVLLYANGLYDLFVIQPSLSFYRRFVQVWMLALATAVAVFYLVPAWRITPKTNLLVVAVLWGLLIIGWRMVCAMTHIAARPRVLFIEPNRELVELISTLHHNKQIGYKVVGVVSQMNGALPLVADDVPRLPATTPVRALVAEHKINLIVVGSEAQTAALNRELYELLFWHVRITTGDSFFESLTGRIQVTSLGERWFFEHVNPERAVLYVSVHTIIDYIVAALGLVVLGLVLPVVALAVRLTDRGPIFFKQERVGHNGKKFLVYKLRTMRVLAPDGSAETGGAQTTSVGDPRVTAVGAVLRKMRIDELPQMINILRGEMSLIGPRPERPQFVHEFEKHTPFFSVRHLVKPGVTGWAQINYPYAETLTQQMKKFQYDLYYLKNRSFFLDVTILLKTVHVVLYGKGR